MPLLITLASLGVATLLVFVVLSFSPSFRARRAHAMSASVGLALTDDVRPIVERAIAVRLRATALGSIVGLLAGVGAMASGAFGDHGQWVLIGAMFLGLGLGSAVGAFLARPRSTPGGTRVARARDVGLRDYVMPIELTGARILVGVAVLIGVGVSALLVGIPRETTALLSLVVVTVLALVALVGFEVLGRVVVRQASPAEDPTRLAWEDALRAETLRNLVTAPLTFGCVAVVLGVVGAFGALPLTPLSIVLGVVAPALLMVAALAIAIVSIVQKPQQHYLRTLWPETAAAIAR